MSPHCSNALLCPVVTRPARNTKLRIVRGWAMPAGEAGSVSGAVCACVFGSVLDSAFGAEF